MKIYWEIVRNFVALWWWSLGEKVSLIVYNVEQRSRTLEMRYALLDSVQKALRSSEEKAFLLNAHQNVLGKYIVRDKRTEKYVEVMKKHSKEFETIIGRAEENLHKQFEFLSSLELEEMEPNPVFNKYYGMVMKFRMRKRRNLVIIRNNQRILSFRKKKVFRQEVEAG